ncbi:MAG: lysylphosphatidylglycerol synthase transmembrane domain-containing protein [Nitrospirota bacterium]
MRLKFWIGIIISAGLLAMMFWWIGFDFRRLWDAVRSIEPWHLVAAAALNLAIYVIRAVRWRYLMDPVKERVKISHLYSATMVGFMANNLLPARLGEIVRAYVIGRREKIPTSSALATLVVERMFDAFTILLLLVIVLVYMPKAVSGGNDVNKIRSAGKYLMIVCPVLIVSILFLAYKQGLMEKIVNQVFRPFPKLGKKVLPLVKKFVSGLSVIKNPRLLAPIVFYSGLHWALLCLPVYIIFKGYGLNLGIYAAAFMLVVIAAAVAVPSTPGYIGTFHAAVAAALMVFGIQKEQAFAVAIVLWAMGYIPVTLIGLYCLSRENLTFSRIKTVEAA